MCKHIESKVIKTRGDHYINQCLNPECRKTFRVDKPKSTIFTKKFNPEKKTWFQSMFGK